jgi:hypothetical protein
MKYPCLDGYILISNPLQPISHTLSVPGYPNGTWINYETCSKSDNTLQQIKITRVVDDENMIVTIEEQNAQQISQYLSDIKEQAIIDTNQISTEDQNTNI